LLKIEKIQKKKKEKKRVRERENLGWVVVGLGEEKSERESTIDLLNTKPHTHFVSAERRSIYFFLCLLHTH